MVLNKAYVIEAGPWAGRNLSDLYEEAWTPWAWVEPIFTHAKSLGLEAFSTPFDVNALAFLERLHCPRYKVASFEIVDLPLIRAIAKTGKPMIISTGMATREEILAATQAAATATGHTNYDIDITLLQCTSAYPARIEDANLAGMKDMACWGRVKVGLSDHSMGSLVAAAATAMGASIIEKHLTLRRSDGGPDAGFSLEPDEFAEMVKRCRDTAKAMGGTLLAHIARGTAENSQRALRRSIFAARDIPQGKVIEATDLVTARPANGMPCKYWDELIGRVATQAIAKGQKPTTTAVRCFT